MLDRKLLSLRASSFHDEGENNHGLPEVQRFNDVGTLLGFFPGLLCLEMYQLRSGHRPNDLQ